MHTGEFDLIERFFKAPGLARTDVRIGIGDDGAVLRIPPGHDISVSVASLLAGRDFPGDADPGSLGHRLLAMAASRIAATGAAPAWVTLALSLPAADERWLERFSAGLHGLARGLGVQLIGGDTTRGDLALTLHCLGLVPRGKALQPRGAQPGDLIYVSGFLGDGGLAVLARRDEVRLGARDRAALEARLLRPEPRCALGLRLRDWASAAVDLPDGLARGLRSLLEASGVGATLHGDALPVSPYLAPVLDKAGGAVLPLTAGGDFELCFTVPAAAQGALEQGLAETAPPVTWIGTVERRQGLRCLLADGTDIAPG